VARDLGVQYVLEGSMRKAGNRVRITGQLIDTVSAAHIWADHFDGVLDNIFDLQDEVRAVSSARSSQDYASLRLGEPVGSQPKTSTPTIFFCAH